MTKLGDGQRRIGLRIAHVARATRTVHWGDAHSFDLLQRLPSVVQRDSPAVSAVVHFSRNTLGGRGFQIQIHYILDEGEIAGLLSVAVNSRRAPLDQAFHEHREHTGVGAARILPGTEHVEVAQRHRLQAEAQREHAGNTRPPAFAARRENAGWASSSPPWAELRYRRTPRRKLRRPG